MRRDLCLIMTLALVVRLLTALPMQRPGYMDASYYVDGALSLYEGRGFSDPFIWNYLDDPEGIPYPSHLYWMPLSSILAYWAFLLFGPTYRAAQVPFGLLSALLPALSYLVAYDVARSRRHAVCAGLLTVFSAFYMAYWVTPDSFAPFAVAGAVCLWALGRGVRGGRAVWFAVAGVGAGLAHLARADGVLLTAVALLACVLQTVSRRPATGDQRPQRAANDRSARPVEVSKDAARNAQHRERRVSRPTLRSGCLREAQPRDATRGTDRASRIRRSALCYLLFAVCYLLAMGPWFVRNWVAIGRPLATSGVQTVWLTEYNDLFSYAKPLDVRSYLAWGMGNILQSKLDGLWKNLGQLLFAGWMVFLAPFGLIGVWRLRCRVELLSAWVYGVALYLAMSLVFTFAGWRGGMLHSMVALLPSLYAAAMEGLDGFVAWMARRRRTWRVHQAQQVFGAAFVLFAVVLSLVLYLRALDKFTGAHPYSMVATWLSEHVPVTARVMINDPATFYYYSRRPCLSIPSADRETVLRVMDRYGASYLVLDENNPSLRDLYDAPRDDTRLALVETFSHGDSKTYLFRIGEP